MTEVVSSLNVFVDNENALSGVGDDVLVDIGNAGITAVDGQFLRISLESFNMYKNFYSVNEYNNVINVKTNLAAADDVTLDKKNYKTIGDISLNFAAKLIEKLNNDTTNPGQFEVTISFPSSNTTIDDTSNRIIKLLLTNKDNGNPSAHGISSCVIQSQSAYGESAYLLGGDIVTDASDVTTESFNVTVDPNTITIEGKYPAQRSTEEHVYLRTNLSNNNLESQGLTGNVGGSHIQSSDILAKIPIDHEFVHFNTSTGREFFLNVPNKSLTQMRFYLRDSKDRQIPTAGSGTQQKKRGNFHFSFVLRIDTIQYPTAPSFQTPKVPKLISARQTGVLEKM